MLLQLSHFFSPLSPSTCTIPPSSIPPPYFMSMGCTYKFFDFSNSSTIPNFPLSILYLPFILLKKWYASLYHLFHVPFLPFSLLPLPADIPPCDLHFRDSFVFQLFAQFVFVFALSSVVDSFEFVVILILIFLTIFFFLDKSL